MTIFFFDFQCALPHYALCAVYLAHQAWRYRAAPWLVRH
ncbi:Uncharacterised protein [Vibrio cholerae]|nr:Uncharacterised protein [Vibrio cholerae]